MSSEVQKKLAKIMCPHDLFSQARSHICYNYYGLHFYSISGMNHSVLFNYAIDSLDLMMLPYVTGPAKTGNVGTNYALSL